MAINYKLITKIKSNINYHLFKMCFGDFTRMSLRASLVIVNYRRWVIDFFFTILFVTSEAVVEIIVWTGVNYEIHF